MALPAIILVLALAGCTATPTSTSDATPTSTAQPTTAPTTAANCIDSLQVTYSPQGDPAFGTGYLVVTNPGSKACELTGFPEVSLLDPSGARFGIPLDHVDVYKESGQAVSIEPNGSAFVYYGFTPAEKVLTGSPTGACDPQIVISTIEVKLPGASSSQTLSIGDVPMCTAKDWMTTTYVGPVDLERRPTGD